MALGRPLMPYTMKRFDYICYLFHGISEKQLFLRHSSGRDGNNAKGTLVTLMAPHHTMLELEALPDIGIQAAARHSARRPSKQ